jgi:3-hydroxyisobutyrate dehydrogenase-like beta-hydroxyacid dehydrogenase
VNVGFIGLGAMGLPMAKRVVAASYTNCSARNSSAGSLRRWKGSLQPGFKLDLMKKDLNLPVESARAPRIALLMVSSMAQTFAAASAAGKGGEDFAAAAQFLASLSGLTLGQAMCHA